MNLGSTRSLMLNCRLARKEFLLFINYQDHGILLKHPEWTKTILSFVTFVINQEYTHTHPHTPLYRNCHAFVDNFLFLCLLVFILLFWIFILIWVCISSPFFLLCSFWKEAQDGFHETQITSVLDKSWSLSVYILLCFSFCLLPHFVCSTASLDCTHLLNFLQIVHLFV
jgi:hypothetical protein